MIVGTPNARRAGPVLRRAAWNRAAKQKVMPTSRATAATCSGVRSSGTPHASTTSAAPVGVVAPRLPCLTTVAGAPQALPNTLAGVEMLIAPVRSPPVRQCRAVAPRSPASAQPACSTLVRGTQQPTGYGLLPHDNRRDLEGGMRHQFLTAGRRGELRNKVTATRAQHEELDAVGRL